MIQSLNNNIMSELPLFTRSHSQSLGQLNLSCMLDYVLLFWTLGECVTAISICIYVYIKYSIIQAFTKHFPDVNLSKNLMIPVWISYISKFIPNSYYCCCSAYQFNAKISNTMEETAMRQSRNLGRKCPHPHSS